MLRARRATRFGRIVKRLDLVAFAALADWLARIPSNVERNERRRAQALDDLRDAVLRGEFGPPAKPEVAYLPDIVPVDRLGRFPLRPRNGQVGEMRFWGSDMTPELWAPRKLCLRWLRKHELKPPPWLERAPAPTAQQRGRPAAPIWVDGEKFIDDWLDENGSPRPGDGEQAKIEAAVREWFVSRTEDPPATSTIRAHVTKGMREHRKKLGVTKGR